MEVNTEKDEENKKENIDMTCQIKGSGEKDYVAKPLHNSLEQIEDSNGEWMPQANEEGNQKKEKVFKNHQKISIFQQTSFDVDL